MGGSSELCIMWYIELNGAFAGETPQLHPRRLLDAFHWVTVANWRFRRRGWNSSMTTRRAGRSERQKVSRCIQLHTSLRIQLLQSFYANGSGCRRGGKEESRSWESCGRQRQRPGEWKALTQSLTHWSDAVPATRFILICIPRQLCRWATSVGQPAHPLVHPSTDGSMYVWISAAILHKERSVAAVWLLWRTLGGFWGFPHLHSIWSDMTLRAVISTPLL